MLLPLVSRGEGGFTLSRVAPPHIWMKKKKEKEKEKVDERVKKLS
jgi:hypothetical protein